MATRKSSNTAVAVNIEPEQVRPWIDLGGTVGRFVLGAIFLIITGTGGYYTFTARLDRIDANVQAQQQSLADTNKSIEKMASAMQRIADEAVTSSDLTAFCMQLELANQKRGWECPFSGVSAGRAMAKPLKRINISPNQFGQ